MRALKGSALRICLPLLAVSCRPSTLPVRAWIESRDRSGAIVAGATVEVDGEQVGLTDPRGLYHLKIDRRVGERVRLEVHREEALQGEKPTAWSTTFTVGTDGFPVEASHGWLEAVLEPVALRKPELPLPGPSAPPLPAQSLAPSTTAPACSDEAPSCGPAR